MDKGSRSLFLKRLRRTARPFWQSQKRRRAFVLLFVIIVLLGAVLGVNVWITSIAGKFATALQARDAAAYGYFLMLYVGAILLATPITVAYGYFRSRMALEWREWLTRYFVEKYFSHRAYYRLASDPQIDNPDERISHDIETFCNMTVGLSIALIDAVITVVMFSGLLWRISPTLSAVAVLYSLAGCVITTLIGNRLVTLNFRNVKLEADLRYSLARIRRDVECIAFYSGEERAASRVTGSLTRTIKNTASIIGVNRNLGFFTSSYNSFVALIPAAVIAPLYFSGSTDFGEITRAGMAFTHVFAGLTLFVGQFNALSAYAANIERLGSFLEKLDGCAGGGHEPAEGRAIKVLEGGAVRFENVTICTPDGARALVRNLALTLPPGASLMITGPSGSGKSSMLRALAGLWTTGTGRIMRPPLEDTMFLPQQPYVPAGTLREALCYPRGTDAASTGALLAMLEVVQLDHLPAQAGGLDIEQQWQEILSLGEQQRLSFARLLLAAPRFAILDESTSALDLRNQRALYSLLKKTGATVISVGHRESIREYHEFALELNGDGTWELYSVKPPARGIHGLQPFEAIAELAESAANDGAEFRRRVLVGSEN